MRHTPHFVSSDADEVRRLIRENPWATLVATTDAGIVASHYPVLLDETVGDAIVLLTHVGRPDERSLGLGEGEIMVIVQGPHGYVSPGWYPEGQIVPTWNHVTAHLWGVPELLDDDENLRVLGDLVDHFEHVMPEPRSLQLDLEGSRRLARGTVGVRLRVTRFDARLKLSQNKSPEVVDRIVSELESGEHYAQPALAREMRRVHPR
ncbi:FMN-binding negative transcriptional regulator [Frigoribacterium sp. 2-23]|uniref:FMN-binding negative transcriptional regulator n=1 Tax=Frigoribacterium sp. 2-23 TaxID=3415006 RepID=UPI003C6EAA33